MKSPALKRALTGFLIGAVAGNVIMLLMTYLAGGPVGIVSDELVLHLGLVPGILLQTVLSGLYGAVCVGGTVFYDIENWSLLKATALHYVSIMASFLFVSLVLRWLPPSIDVYLVVFLMFSIVFAVIWIVMYLKWKRKISEMNLELDRYKARMRSDR